MMSSGWPPSIWQLRRWWRRISGYDKDNDDSDDDDKDDKDDKDNDNDDKDNDDDINDDKDDDNPPEAGLPSRAVGFHGAKNKLESVLAAVHFVYFIFLYNIVDMNKGGVVINRRALNLRIAQIGLNPNFGTLVDLATKSA